MAQYLSQEWLKSRLDNIAFLQTSNKEVKTKTYRFSKTITDITKFFYPMPRYLIIPYLWTIITTDAVVSTS